MTDQDPLATIGDNNPPPYDPAEVERLNIEAAQFLDAAAEWLEAGPITTEDQAAKLNDFISGTKKRKTATDEARKVAKKPHNDAGDAVQAAYVPIIDKMLRAVTKVTPLLSAWLIAKETKRLAEVKRQQDAARAMQVEADEKAKQAAARNDISGEIDAEAATKAAEKAAADAQRLAKTTSKVSSSSGGGRTAALRPVIEVTVTNPRVLFMRYQEHPDLLECLRNLAAREARTKDFDAKVDKIPGAKITVTMKAV